jgi:flagellar export protein FliJ
MKRFHFPLDRVLDWREKQLEIEESRLERLAGELRILDARRDALDAQQRESDLSVTRSNLFSASDLQSIDSFRRYATRERTIIASQHARIEQQIEEQRARLLEARRNFELLRRVREKRFGEWKRDFDREIEQQAAEFYLGRIETAKTSGRDSPTSDRIR